MASTNFINKKTIVPADWLNEVNGTVWSLFNAASTASAGRTALGLGTLATQNANSVTITGGTISNLSSPIPVASGGTGETTSTGSGAIVKASSPTITNLLISGSIISAATGGGDIVRFVGTSSSAENSLRIDQAEATSGVGLKLSNTGLNKQTTLRGNADGGFTFYVNQAAGEANTSGTTALTVTSAAAANFAGALSENNTRVFSRNSTSPPDQPISGSQFVYGLVDNTYTFPHSLGQSPIFISVWFECISASANTSGNNYAVGDRLFFGTNTTATSGVTVKADASNIYVTVTGNVTVADPTVPANMVTLNASFIGASWLIKARAWF